MRRIHNKDSKNSALVLMKKNKENTKKNNDNQLIGTKTIKLPGETKSKTYSNDEVLVELKRQLRWYKSFFDKATDAVFIVEPDTWVIFEANDHAANLLGLSKSNLIGTSLPQFRRIFKLLQKSSSPAVLSELIFEVPTNPALMIEVSAQFINYNGKRFIQAIARDISEQYALTEKLVQADKLVLLGQLLAGITHEIRNPLAAVNLNLQNLSRKISETTKEFNNDSPQSIAWEQALNYIKTALQGVERISKIVDVTLNFSRPSVPEIQAINLNNIIPSSLDLVSSILRKKDITIETTFDKDLPLVAADAKQIQQVFINLITNAIDAIDSKGKIIINSYSENINKSSQSLTKNDLMPEKFVVVSIKDNGVGIAPEELPKIFNPFFTRKIDGTGLGLPITQRIMHQHRGIIDVESVLDKGTTFYIKLPVINDI